MQMHGIVMSATLDENPPESGIVEMTIRVQGVGAGQPRRIVLPFAILIQDESLDPSRSRTRFPSRGRRRIG